MNDFGPGFIPLNLEILVPREREREHKQYSDEITERSQAKRTAY